MKKIKKVLVIDDEDIVRVCCKRVLKPKGISVDTAADGVEGLKMVHENGYDVVFTDLKMPGIEGQEVVKNIKRISPTTKVVVVTGYFTEQMKERAEKAGADFFMEKPFCPDGILEALKEL